MEKQQILVAMTAGDSNALGNVWRITAKKSDFYLEPLDELKVVHLSAHGPNDKFDNHRFHIKIDPSAAASAQTQGRLVVHDVSDGGYAIDGRQLRDRTFLVARIRFTWHLQRAEFQAAAFTRPTPELAAHQSAKKMPDILPAGSAWDLDLVVSYDEPYWPDSDASLKDDSRLGPVGNDSGMWLTATSYFRSERVDPSPDGLQTPLPQPGETPNRILAGGPGPDAPGDLYWFLETITTRGVIEANIAKQQGQ